MPEGAAPLVPRKADIQEGYELPCREVAVGSARVRIFEVPAGDVALRDTLVCLPGMGASGRSFAPMAPLKDRVRLLFWTPPLHTPRGVSPLAHNLEALAHPTAPLPERYVLLGSSFGSLIALVHALNHPARVKALILVSPIASTKRLRRPAALAEAFLRTPLPFAYLFAPLVARILGGARLPKAARAEIVREARRLSPMEVARRLRDVLRSDLLPRLSELKLPTLVLHGSRDRVVPVSAAEDVARQIPNARFELLPGAAHLPYMSHPREFNRQVADFLAAVP